MSQASRGAPFWEEPSTEDVIYYFHNDHDHLGTPQIVMDGKGLIVWKATYKPFGETEVDPNATVANNFRFPGQYFDKETGLHYNYFRYYHLMTGRYFKPDPLSLSQIEVIMQTTLNRTKVLLPDPYNEIRRFLISYVLYWYGLTNPHISTLYPYAGNSPINFMDPRGLVYIVPINPRHRPPGGLSGIGGLGSGLVDLGYHPPYVEYPELAQLSEGAKFAINVAAQTLAEELSEDFLGKTFAFMLRRVNFLLNVFELFPRKAHAPGLDDDASLKGDRRKWRR